MVDCAKVDLRHHIFKRTQPGIKITDYRNRQRPGKAQHNAAAGQFFFGEISILEHWTL